MSLRHRQLAATLLLLSAAGGMCCALNCDAQESDSRNELLSDLPMTVPDNVVREPKPAQNLGEKNVKPGQVRVPVRGADAEPTADQRAAQISTLLQKATAQLSASELSLELKQVQQQILHQMDEWLSAEQGGTAAASGKSAEEGNTSSDAGEGTNSTSNGKRTGDNTAGEQPASQASGNDPSGGALPNGKGANGKGDSGTGAATDAKSVRELADSFWGKLPPQERQRLKDSIPERFLPQYQRQIEAYYRAIAQPQMP